MVVGWWVVKEREKGPNAPHVQTHVRYQQGRISSRCACVAAILPVQLPQRQEPVDGDERAQTAARHLHAPGAGGHLVRPHHHFRQVSSAPGMTSVVVCSGDDVRVAGCARVDVRVAGCVNV